MRILSTAKNEYLEKGSGLAATRPTEGWASNLDEQQVGLKLTDWYDWFFQRILRGKGKSQLIFGTDGHMIGTRRTIPNVPRISGPFKV